MANSGVVYFAGVVVLIAVILVAGCSQPAPAPLPPSTIQPGQEIELIGEVTGTGIVSQGIPHGTIDAITFTIGLTPDTMSVNLENLTIIYADAVRTETLVPVEGYRGTPPRGSWGILSVTNEVGKPNNRLEFEEQATIQIDPKAAIVPNQVITIYVKTPAGPPLTIRRVVPSTIMPGINDLPQL